MHAYIIIFLWLAPLAGAAAAASSSSTPAPTAPSSVRDELLKHTSLAAVLVDLTCDYEKVDIPFLNSEAGSAGWRKELFDKGIIPAPGPVEGKSFDTKYSSEEPHIDEKGRVHVWENIFSCKVPESGQYQGDLLGAGVRIDRRYRSPYMMYALIENGKNNWYKNHREPRSFLKKAELIWDNEKGRFLEPSRHDWKHVDFREFRQSSRSIHKEDDNVSSSGFDRTKYKIPQGCLSILLSNRDRIEWFCPKVLTTLSREELYATEVVALAVANAAKAADKK